MTPPRSCWLLPVFAVISWFAANNVGSAADFRMSDITGQGYGGVISGLIGDDGHTRSRDDFKGRVTVLLFGFTHCPNVCPTALVNLSAVLDLLGEDRDLVQIAFITVDPARDTPEILHEYTGAFGPNFVGLTGETNAIRQVARAFKVFFQKKLLPGGDYTVDHSIAIYILDKQARTRLMFTANRKIEDIVHDILKLIRETN
jgi:protein SCO1